MGRLTLNVLLSFAQFEREVTSERIRDKVAASKRKGMWMGGPVPLGYRLENRKLIVEESEAETIRLIFRRYLELKSTSALADELAHAGIRSKVRTYSNGRTRGGCRFTIGSLAQLLQNPLFAGKVRLRNELFDGEHQGIVEEAVWGDVQQLLASNRRERLLGKRARSPGLLTGLITDPDGRPMTPVFTTKGARQHRYYVTRLKPGEDRKTAWRIPAGDVDRIVLNCVADAITRSVACTEPTSSDRPGELLLESSVDQQRRVLLDEEVRVQVTASELIVRVGVEEGQFRLPARLLKRGSELKLVLDGETSSGAPDPVLLKLLTHARLAQQAVISGGSDALVSSYSKAHLRRLLKLSWLAPDIVAGIAEGKQPPTLTGRRLLRAADVPLGWEEQRRFFGFH